MNHDDLTPDQIPGDHLAIITGNGRYSGRYPNRRCRRNAHRGRIVAYNHYYRDSWGRYQKYIPKCLMIGYSPNDPITVTMHNIRYHDT